MAINGTCEFSNSLNQLLMNSAMRIFDDFVKEKNEDIINKYEEDPCYIKVCELLKERKQLINKIDEIEKELNSTFSSSYFQLNSCDSRYVINKIAGIIDIREKLYDDIQTHIAIETYSSDFNPRHIFNEVNEMARKAISKINI